MRQARWLDGARCAAKRSPKVVLRALGVESGDGSILTPAAGHVDADTRGMARDISPGEFAEVFGVGETELQPVMDMGMETCLAARVLVEAYRAVGADPAVGGDLRAEARAALRSLKWSDSDIDAVITPKAGGAEQPAAQGHDAPSARVLAVAEEKLRGAQWDNYVLRYDCDMPPGLPPGSKERLAFEALIRSSVYFQISMGAYTVAKHVEIEWPEDGSTGRLRIIVRCLGHPDTVLHRRGPARPASFWKRTAAGMGRGEGQRSRFDTSGNGWNLPYAFMRHVRTVAAGRRHSASGRVTLRWRTVCKNVCSRTLRRCGLGTSSAGFSCQDERARFEAFEIPDADEMQTTSDPVAAARECAKEMHGCSYPCILVAKLLKGSTEREASRLLDAAKARLVAMRFHALGFSRHTATPGAKPYACDIRFRHAAPLVFMWVMQQRALEGAVKSSTAETSVRELRGDMGDDDIEMHEIAPRGLRDDSVHAGGAEWMPLKWIGGRHNSPEPDSSCVGSSHGGGSSGEDDADPPRPFTAAASHAPRNGRTGSAPSGGDATAGILTCPVCTFHNPLGATSCSMCGSSF